MIWASIAILERFSFTMFFVQANTEKIPRHSSKFIKCQGGNGRVLSLILAKMGSIKENARSSGKLKSIGLYQTMTGDAEQGS